MNFLFPVFKKDLMHLRFVLICWMGLFCLQSFLGIGGMRIAADDLYLQMILPQLAMFIRFMQGMMVIILVPLLVQSDPLVGTTAFWFTRPIGRKELLVTKVCFAAGIFVLLALLAELIVFTANGFPLKYILLAIPEILIEKTAFIIPLFLLAVITPKFSRYMIIGVSILVITIIASVLFSILSTFIPESMYIDKIFLNAKAEKSHTLSLSILVAGYLFAVLFGGGVIAYQYLRRKTKWTVVWIFSGVILLIILCRFWSIDFIRVDSSTSETTITADAITFTIDTGGIDSVRYQSDSNRSRTFEAPIKFSCSASEEFPILTDMSSVIDYPNNDKLESPYIPIWWGDSIDNITLMNCLQSELVSSKILNPLTDSKDRTYDPDHKMIFGCDEKALNSHKNIQGIYKASVKFDIFKYKICSTLPLTPGSQAKLGAEQFMIFDILDRENGISVVVIEKKVSLLFDLQTEKSHPYGYSFPHSVYLIENIKRGEAFMTGNPDGSMGYGRTIDASWWLSSKIGKLEFVYINRHNGALPKIDKEWLKDARLVRVDAVRVGSVTKQIEIKDFVLPEKSTNREPEENPIEENPITP